MSRVMRIQNVKLDHERACRIGCHYCLTSEYLYINKKNPKYKNGKNIKTYIPLCTALALLKSQFLSLKKHDKSDKTLLQSRVKIYMENITMKNKLNKSKSKYGVGEWADYSYNIGDGCINNCRYCYARDIAVDISKKGSNPLTRADWPTEQVKTWKSDINQKVNGIVMLPSMHDITEAYLPTYMDTLRNLLKAGNDVLIVTKPRLACIKAICDEFTDYKDNILIRMTITSMDNNLSQYWESGAPLPQERIEALIYAHEQGYQTSVSVEPMIDTVERTVAMYQLVEPYITEDIWFGKMNSIKYRVDISDKLTREAVATIYENQSNKNVLWLYEQLKDQPKVMWKDSIRNIVRQAA